MMLSSHAEPEGSIHAVLSERTGATTHTPFLGTRPRGPIPLSLLIRSNMIRLTNLIARFGPRTRGPKPFSLLTWANTVRPAT